MTLIAIWRNEEEPRSPRLWIATDSRIRDDQGTLIDEGIKLQEISVACWRPGPSGFFDTPYFATSVGVAGAGSSLIYQHACGTLSTLLGRLVAPSDTAPTTADIASLAAAVATKYVRSLGERRPASARKVALVVAGESPGQGHRAYKLAPRLDEDEMLSFGVEPLDLGGGAVHFFGDRVPEAESLLDGVVGKDRSGAQRHRAALEVIRAMINDPEVESIGGEVQVGYTIGTGFRRVASVVADRANPPEAHQLVNSIDIAELPSVGPCVIGIDGMALR